jgi:hypothetical protein
MSRSFWAKVINPKELCFLAAEAVELDAEVVGGAVGPLFEVAVEEHLAGDAVRRPEEVADLVEERPRWSLSRRAWRCAGVSSPAAGIGPSRRSFRAKAVPRPRTAARARRAGTDEFMGGLVGRRGGVGSMLRTEPGGEKAGAGAAADLPTWGGPIGGGRLKGRMVGK